ncbi:MAG TPA: NADH-quinone oxidoreductase subunit NuoG, partial [Caldilineaceae bacterium]|nr:NADH-quinone oxidoreductase subunit NuoG [Caldilineaceae bacterium]
MTELVNLKIDDRPVSVPKGTLVVDAAAALDIEIPVFCSHPKLDPVACCRMCLVEISGPRGMMLQTACSVPVAEGMEVKTETANVKATQEATLAFILLNHPLDCPICDKGGECPLQDQTMRYGPGISQLVEPKRHKNKHYMTSDTIVLDQERCVICGRCIRYLEEWEDKPQLGLFERGGETLIDIQHGKPVDAKTGGNIIDICPVGALTNRVARFAYRPWEIERTPSIDPHFSTGDNIRIDTRTHKLRRIVGRENMAVNDQWIADKTRFAYEWVNSEERLTTPLVRKNGVLTPVAWGEALKVVAEQFKRIKQASGADAIGGIGSTKLSNEANYLFQRFFRQLVGTNNIDHRDGGDVAALPTGLPAIADLMKPQYGPDPKVDLIVLVGVDPSEELPILAVHLKRAVRRGKAKLIIAHPRQIELTRYRGPYLAYRPGSEVTLLNGLTRYAAAVKGDEQGEVAQLTAAASDEKLTELCGVDPATVKQAAELLAQSTKALIIYGPQTGRGKAGQQTLNALTNLALLTGHHDRLAYVGLDANSQGCRDMGVLPNRLPGHAGVDDETARGRLQQLWGGSLPTAPGKSYKEMLDAAGGAIKALYIMGANPASERPGWAANLDKLDFLVVQELFLTETAKLADVVLPAVSWAEANGTFTNCERRVQRAPKAFSNPRSKAAPDWMILDHLATHLGVNWPYANEKGITAEISKAVPIYEGLTWEALGDQGLQWDAAAVRQTPAYRKAEQPALPAVAEGELVLITGPVTYDGGTMFYQGEVMPKLAFPTAVVLNPADALRLQTDEGAPVTVRSAYGALQLAVKLDAQVRPGSAWIPEGLPGAPVGALLNGSD